MFKNLKLQGFERYKVSKRGKIMSPKGRILKPYVDKRNANRKPFVTLKTLENKSSSFSVQTLIDSAFSIEEQKAELILLNINNFTYDYIFNKIEDLRLENKMTWKKISEICESSYLKQKLIRKTLHVVDLIRLTDFFNLPISYFFGGDQMMQMVNSTLKNDVENLKIELKNLEKENLLLTNEIKDKTKIIELYGRIN